METRKLNPSHDTALTIFVGASSKATNWENKETTWSDLLNRCANTTKTKETLVQYLQMDKAKQSKIKDVGGFVGGYFATNGRRKKEGLIGRTVVTLDADNVKKDSNIWEGFKATFSFAACIYSTHKHTEEAPRLRIIIPLADSTNVEQYEAVARYIADKIGMEYFDPTTFQASRLMFWPSTPKDVDFFFDWQDGEILDPEEILKKYKDWKDVSSWPMHKSETPEAILNNKRKAPDPTAKAGIVGAFCNAYTIEEAIEKFLPDVYAPTLQGDRYTYKNGSTYGGLVVYKDGYAFSNHATDPARLNGQHGCNAFDLVRIHKFGAEDTGIKEDTPINRRPSFLKMGELATKDTKVKRYILKQRAKSVKDDFEGVDFEESGQLGSEQTQEDGETWKDKLTLNKKMEVENTPTNLVLLFLNDPELKQIKFDTFRNRDFSFSERFKNTKGAIINEESTGKISLYFFTEWNIKVRQSSIFDYLQTTATERSFNPVQDFIRREEWDGTKRIETALIDYLGAADTELTRTITKKWFVGAVARAFEPGIKFDYVLTIPGPQGIGKSTFFNTIAGSWFSDSFSFAAKDNAKFEAVNSAWILEISELNGLKRTEAEAAKQFISKQKDTYRAAYGRTVEDYPRHCVFAATTNEEYFLTGVHGNRRWWIVKAEGKGRISSWLGDLKVNVGQLWAEAYKYYMEGEELCLPESLDKEAEKIQDECNQAGGDDLLPIIESFLDELLPTDWETKNKEERRSFFRYRDPLEAVGTVKRKFVTAEVIRNELPDELVKKYPAQRINALLERCNGWKLTSQRTKPGQCYARARKLFVRIPDEEEDNI